MKPPIKILFLFSFLFCGTLLNAQNSDSLKLVLKNAKHDTTRVVTLARMIENEADAKVWVAYNDEMKKLCEKNLAAQPSAQTKKIFQKYLAESHINAAYIFYLKGNLDSTLKEYDISLKINEEADDKNGICTSLHNMASILSLQNKDAEALTVLNRCLKIQQELKDLSGITVCYNKMGQIFSVQGNISKALEYWNDGLKIAEESGDKVNQSALINNLGTIYSSQGDYARALEYNLKGLEKSYSLKDKIATSTFLNNIGSNYDGLKNYAKGLEFHLKSLNAREEIGDRQGVSNSYNNIGSVYFSQDSFQKARDYYFKSLAIAEELKIKRMIASELGYIGGTYIAEKQFEKAKPFELRAMEISKEMGYPENLRDVAKHLTLIYKNSKDFQKAFEMYQLFVVMRDSVFSNQTKRASLRSQLRYDFEKKAAADSLKTAGEKMIAAAELKHEKTKNFALYGGLALVILFAVFMFNRFRVTQKQKRIIELQKKSVEQQKDLISMQKHIVEEKQKEILDSITYAKRLQEAILPAEINWLEHLPNSFVLYKPKDIVAGDFYWMEKINDSVFFAAADCTGHGVPGALVSVVCSNALNRTVLEFGITDPGKILDKTRELVITTFEKSDKDVKDGMDISLCCFNTTTNELLWAGANNPLWIISASVGKDEAALKEFTADKQPIGKYAEQKPFTTHKIQLKNGDSIYVFTDGYADQFGGPNGKKFKYKQVKEIILSNFKLSPAEQKQKLNDLFENWRGDLEQIDDVCIIGLKI